MLLLMWTKMENELMSLLRCLINVPALQAGFYGIFFHYTTGAARGYKYVSPSGSILYEKD